MKVAAIALAGTAAVVSAQTLNIKPLILGGTVMPVGEKTYTVGLRWSAGGENVCGGSLISPTQVLPAAHCTGYAKFVAVGLHFFSGTTDRVRVAIKKQPHPFFDPSSMTYAYSILTLASPVTDYSPVKLLSANSATFTGSTATTMGWGDTTSQGKPSKQLLRVDVPVVSTTVCKAANLTYPISQRMMCAGGNANMDACRGDSGGPIIIEQATGDVLVGVVSWRDKCGLAGKPGVYSKVSFVKRWILTNAPNVTFVWDVCRLSLHWLREFWCRNGLEDHF